MTKINIIKCKYPGKWIDFQIFVNLEEFLHRVKFKSSIHLFRHYEHYFMVMNKYHELFGQGQFLDG